MNLDAQEFTRLANNFYNQNNLESHLDRISVDASMINYIQSHMEEVKTRHKVAFVWICLNPPYWEFARPMIEGAQRFFLPGHDVDYFLWSDMPKTKEEVSGRIYQHLQQVGTASVISTDPSAQTMMLNVPPETADAVKNLSASIEGLHSMPKVTIFPIESIEWPMPTLLRYHTFLQQEEILSKYDYIFYCDVDMAFVDVVGDEILADGLTATMNPMYALAPNMYPPYEPNPNSTAYIKRPGQLVSEPNSQSEIKARFMPQYYAGGFQGGKGDQFLQAMKVMRKNIDQDFNQNYIAIWNEESHWNKYLFENPPAKVLNQSYLYPDSLQNEYYIPRWGRNYPPKLVTLTKKFSLRKLSPQEQEQLTMMQKR